MLLRLMSLKVLVTLEPVLCSAITRMSVDHLLFGEDTDHTAGVKVKCVSEQTK